MANTRRRYTAEEKQEILSEIENGKSIAEVAEEKQISPATLRAWTKKPTTKREVVSPAPVTAEGIKAELAQYDRQIENLKAQIEKVEEAKKAYLDNLKAVLESIAG